MVMVEKVVQHAREHGVRAAARELHVSRQTVRKYARQNASEGHRRPPRSTT
jgi:hypothetical protein